jgi:hypothetical protein
MNERQVEEPNALLFALVAPPSSLMLSRGATVGVKKEINENKILFAKKTLTKNRNVAEDQTRTLNN